MIVLTVKALSHFTQCLVNSPAFEATIDYMVFTPLRTRGQGSSSALKPKSQGHCLVKGENAGGNDGQLWSSFSQKEAPPALITRAYWKTPRLRILACLKS